MNAVTPLTPNPRHLTLDDIADLRAYERERAEFRSRIIELKARRRVQVGELVTLLFENRDTIRFQIQEMARVEKLITDDAIRNELRAYNPLIPAPGNLSATMFIELVSDAELRYWLPKLVGIERCVAIELADGTRVGAVVEESHEAQLTREDVTSAVHYVRFELTGAQIEALAAGPARLVVDHPEYRFSTELSPATVAELLADLRP